MNIADLMREAHDNSTAKGFHDKPKELAVDIALIHSELSEVLEEVRAGRADDEIYYEVHAHGEVGTRPERGADTDKPCGIATEFADAVIRILDVCAHRGIPLERAIAEKMAYNRTRPRMHGGKRL